MSLARFPARNHPVARRGVDESVDDGVDESVDDRATPPELFAALHERFGFTIDVAAAPHNAKLPRFFSKDADGLQSSWDGERVWCNPPFSSIRPWIEKAWMASPRAELIALLLPANRTEQPWWQELVEPFRDRPGSVLRVEFLPGRPRFIRQGEKYSRPPFGCVLLVWNEIASEAVAAA